MNEVKIFCPVKFDSFKMLLLESVSESCTFSPPSQILLLIYQIFFIRVPTGFQNSKIRKFEGFLRRKFIVFEEIFWQK